MFHVALVFFVISPRIFPGFEDAAKEISGLACDSVNGVTVGKCYRCTRTLKLTFSSLKMDGWNAIVSFWGQNAYFQGRTVSFREGISHFGGLSGGCCFVYFFGACKAEDVST